MSTSTFYLLLAIGWIVIAVLAMTGVYYASVHDLAAAVPLMFGAICLRLHLLTQ